MTPDVEQKRDLYLDACLRALIEALAGLVPTCDHCRQCLTARHRCPGAEG